MMTKKQIEAAAIKFVQEEKEWEMRREWERNWQESVKGQKFKIETVMEKQPIVTGKPSTILPSRGLKVAKK